MKSSFTIFLCLVINFAFAQNLPPSSNSLEFYPEKFPKATVYMENDSSIQGKIMKITDNMVTLSAYLNDTAKNKSLIDVSIGMIKKIKIKKNIGVSMAGGAVITGLAGYGLGYITYTEDHTISDDDNKDRQHLRAGLGALITAVPGAFIGMITGLFHKQNFVINGSNEKMKRLMRALR